MLGSVSDPQPPISPGILSRLVDNHSAFLAFLERRVGTRELAEEILQEAFVRGIERGGTIRDAESAIAWFYRLLRRAVIDHARRRTASDRSLQRWADELGVAVQLDESLQARVCACLAARRHAQAGVRGRPARGGGRGAGRERLRARRRHQPEQRGRPPAPSAARARRAPPGLVRNVRDRRLPRLHLRVMAAWHVRQHG